MKAVISGPRSGLTEDLKLPWMNIEVELEELPADGEVIILNDGSSYYVKDKMWWVDAPENEAYWSRADRYEVEGQYKVVYIHVEPDNRRERYGYPAGVEDGKVMGGDDLIAELRGLVDILKNTPDGNNRVDYIDTWLKSKEKAVASRKDTEKRQAEAAEQIIAEIRKEEKW